MTAPVELARVERAHAARTRAELARRLVLAFLRNTECRAVPLDGLAPAIAVERAGGRVIFEFVDAGDALADRAVDGVAVFAVRWFDEVRVILERLGWRRGLLDD